jgi:hypothetical protein
MLVVLTPAPCSEMSMSPSMASWSVVTLRGVCQSAPQVSPQSAPTCSFGSPTKTAFSPCCCTSDSSSIMALW